MVFWLVQGCDFWHLTKVRGDTAFTFTLLCCFLWGIFSPLCSLWATSILYFGEERLRLSDVADFCFAESLSWSARCTFFYFFISFLFLRNCVHYRAATASPPPPLLCLISYDWHCSVLFTMHHSVSVAASLTVRFCSAAGLKRMALQLRSQRCLVSRTERVMIGVPVLNKQESAVRDELQLY